MKRVAVASLSALALAGMSACSEQTQSDAAQTIDLAEDDALANLEVAGEAIEEGAIDAADAVSKGAAELRDDLEAGDTEEPGPAPVTGGEPARD
ncbi:hypothetical protein P8Q88_06265 [Qipengyuania sp. XHP0207]|uniref:hypothetical protein n=1 Tax=Qipengyuania sp. XHP0207 TaxID=3038078 RepID=UPI00241CAAF8|nr:hypothetical protein [Qipengyuania sp. XHP0207]MDG5747780.1 hypothetical protein [Qipengyuania sp. XHP0207]